MNMLENVKLKEDLSALIIIDQTLLPGEIKFEELNTKEGFYDAIYLLKVRGAPCIGITAAYAMAVLGNKIDAKDFESFKEEFCQIVDYLKKSRPTAVNLFWAIEKMKDTMLSLKGEEVSKVKEELFKEAREIHEEDIRMCRKISEYGLSLLKNGDGVLTHCNAGPLATSKYGTGQGPFFLAKEQGIDIKVFADETRPLLQGARITSFELEKAGVDVTLICDNMASIVMKNGWVQACMVGCDRVAMNGDAANKIGTSGVAILAKYYDIPFYVLGPTSTIDENAKTGADIEIELRPAEEIKNMHYASPKAPENVKAYNPAFDVTDNQLIAGIVTEWGIARAPYEKSLREIMDKKKSQGRF